MEEIKPVGGNYKEEYGDDNDYFSVEDEDGVLRCSCGSELVKMDEETWKCPGGYPVYRFAKGEVIIDRNGNLMFKSIPHGNDGKIDEGDPNG